MGLSFYDKKGAFWLIATHTITLTTFERHCVSYGLLKCAQWSKPGGSLKLDNLDPLMFFNVQCVLVPHISVLKIGKGKLCSRDCKNSYLKN